MKFTRTFVLIGAGLLLAALTAFAAEEKVDAKNDAPKEWTNQTHCPVMGGEIDSAVYTDIQGHRVYHCCAMCKGKVEEDPDAFFQKAAEAGIRYENIQTTCPVSGKELKDKTVYTDYKGRRIYFCCPNCIDSFTENASEFLAKMDKPADEESAEADDGAMDHGKHGDK